MASSRVKNGNGSNSALVRRLNILAATLFIIIGIRFIATDLIAPLLIAAMFAVLLLPIFNIFRKRGLSRNVSLGLMIVTIVLTAGALVYLLQFSFGLIQESINAVVKQANEVTENTSTPVEQFLEQYAVPIKQAVAPKMLLGYLDQISAGLSNLFLYLIIIPVLAVVLVSQVDSFSEHFKVQFEKSGPSFTKFRKFETSVRAYITGRFKVNLATALLLTPVLLFMGVDYPILWGFLTLILGFIPYIGIIIAGAGPFLIVTAEHGLPGAIILIIAYFIVIFITENIIDPHVQGKQNRLTTLSVIVGFLFWSWLFGVLGTIIAAPLTVMLKTFFEDYPETKWIAMLMVGDYSKAPKSTHDYKKIFGAIKKRLPTIK